MFWKEFEQSAPQLAAFGRDRVNRRVCYLATVRKDGAPRVHPVTPLIAGGHLLVFMYPTSPKAYDLRRDGRFALHTSVLDNDGTGGEFAITGRTRLVENAGLKRDAAEIAGHTAADRYILFEFEIASASSTVYDGGTPVRKHWKGMRHMP
jgi:hypothetical protein